MGQAAIIEEKLKRAEYGEGAAATIAAELGISQRYVFAQNQVWDRLVSPRIKSATGCIFPLSAVKWYTLALTAPKPMVALEHAEAEWADPKRLKRYTTIEFKAWINGQRRKVAVEAAKDLPDPQQLSQDSIDYAHDIKISALTQIGVMLQATPKAKGTRGQLKGSTPSGGTRLGPPETDGPPTLGDLGIAKKESALARKLAKLPPEQLEQVKTGAATVTKVIRDLNHANRPPVATAKWMTAFLLIFRWCCGVRGGPLGCGASSTSSSWSLIGCSTALSSKRKTGRSTARALPTW